MKEAEKNIFETENKVFLRGYQEKNMLETENKGFLRGDQEVESGRNVGKAGNVTGMVVGLYYKIITVNIIILPSLFFNISHGCISS